jgi:raffinose/stachyose/melibiose transport system permease protein
MSALSVRPRARSRVRAKWVTIALFLGPALAIYLLFVLYPVVQAAHYSLFKWNGLTDLNNFIGLKNYTDALGDPLFQQAISNNAFVMILSLVIQIPFSLMLAVLLNRRFPGRAFFRVIFFLPYVLSEAVTGIIFLLMLQAGGVDPFLTALLKGIGLGGLAQDWLGDNGFVMVTLFFIISWKYFGFHMIILLAGLQGIPREIEEAALIDGAGRWQAFRHVTLPLLGPTIRVSVFLSMIGALQLFDMIWVTTKGGPLDASQTIATVMIQEGYYATKMGYGSALAVILFILGLILALLYQRFVLSRDIEGGATAFNG